MCGDILRLIKLNIKKMSDNKKTMYRLVLILVILIIALIVRVKNSSTKEVRVDASENNLRIHEMYVDIGGAVKNPGVYQVKEDTRLYEVVSMAGGFSENADLNTINQAAFVEDGQKIIIPTISKDGSEINESLDETGNITRSNTNIDTSSDKVNINSASKDELETLNGIGPVIAQRIIEHRSISRFESIEDIMSVKGIGNAIFEKIKDKITV